MPPVPEASADSADAAGWMRLQAEARARSEARR